MRDWDEGDNAAGYQTTPVNVIVQLVARGRAGEALVRGLAPLRPSLVSFRGKPSNKISLACELLVYERRCRWIQRKNFEFRRKIRILD